MYIVKILTNTLFWLPLSWPTLYIVRVETDIALLVLYYCKLLKDATRHGWEGPKLAKEVENLGPILWCMYYE